MQRQRASLRPVRRGFNLIEAAIVLGVVGLVIGGIWAAAASVQSNMRISKTSAGVLTVVENAKKLFAGHDVGYMTSLFGTAGWNMGIFAGTDAFSRGAFWSKNLWGGDVMISISQSGTTTCVGCGRIIEFAFFGGGMETNRDMCVGLLRAVTSGKATSSLFWIDVYHADGSQSGVSPSGTIGEINTEIGRAHV